jgi:hypothetical protein
MLCFWCISPEIESSVWILDSGLGMSLLGVNKVNKLDWIFDEEDWSIVSDHIVVAFLGVELNCETTWVTIAVICTSFSCNC